MSDVYFQKVGCLSIFGEGKPYPIRDPMKYSLEPDSTFALFPTLGQCFGEFLVEREFGS